MSLWNSISFDNFKFFLFLFWFVPQNFTEIISSRNFLFLLLQLFYSTVLLNLLNFLSNCLIKVYWPLNSRQKAQKQLPQCQRKSINEQRTTISIRLRWLSGQKRRSHKNVFFFVGNKDKSKKIRKRQQQNMKKLIGNLFMITLLKAIIFRVSIYIERQVRK